MKTKNLENFGGIEYLTIEDVPIVDSEDGEIIDVHYPKLEKIAGRELIKARVPIRGKELRFLRSAARISQEQLGAALGVSRNAIKTWEKDEDKRLLIVNEIAIRAFFADELEVDFPKSFQELQSTPSVHTICLKAS